MAKQPGALSEPMIDREAYGEIEKEKLQELRRRVGRGNWIREFLWAGVISPGVAHETRADWLRTRRRLDLTRARLFQRDGVSRETAHQLATATAYLELAGDTRDLAESWSFVNQANEILCALADDGERAAFLDRMLNWEPILEFWLAELYSDVKDLDDKLKEKRSEREDGDICKRVAVYTQQWHLVNQWVSFSRRLWRLALGILIAALVAAIVVAEILYVPTETQKATITYPFLCISVLGLFGGALSALYTAQASKVTAVTFGQSQSRVVIRLILGASGAFVIYTLISMPGLLSSPMLDFFKEVQGFVALGIVAGFSEQLFKNALLRLERQFPADEAEDGQLRTTTQQLPESGEKVSQETADKGLQSTADEKSKTRAKKQSEKENSQRSNPKTKRGAKTDA